MPAPFSWLAELAIWLATSAWWVVTHITANVAELGPAWAVAYWLAVLGLWNLGGWGIARGEKSLRGNDLWEVDPGRRGGSWVGHFTAGALRAIVSIPARAGASAMYIGYGGAVALLAVGLVWRWLAIVPATWAVAKLLNARRSRILYQRGLIP